MSLLEVTNLHVRYGGAVAVRGIDLRVDTGEVLVILGANGAGKTSTLRTLAGQLRQSQGSIRWNGKDVSTWRSYRIAREGLALVPEGRKVFAPLTVRENLLVGAFTNRSKARRGELLDTILEMFPVLNERQRQPAGHLSGGEQQMLAFGRAMMADPKMILMDEPSMGLSPAMVDFVLDSIHEIAKTGIGILMAEQNAMAALSVATRAQVLERGEFTLAGTAEEIRSHPDVVKAFLGDQAEVARGSDE